MPQSNFLLPWFKDTQQWDRMTGTALQGETPVLKMSGGCELVVVGMGAPREEQEEIQDFVLKACTQYEALRSLTEDSAVVLHALKAAQLEFVTLESRLTKPYSDNAHYCAEACKKAIARIEEVRAAS